MNKYRILVVEDEIIVARDLCAQLLALGYDSVGPAHTGEQAVALVAELQPDLVLMDIRLGPGMDGITAALQIRSQTNLPFVFLSAYAADDILQRAQLVEPYGYILKPFTERELHIVLQMAFYKLQAQARERELALSNQAILDNMTQGVITLDAQGVVASVNRSASAMFGYQTDELQGQNVIRLMAPEVRQQHQHFLQADARDTSDKIMCQEREMEGVRKDQSLFPLSLTVSRMLHAGRAVYICIMTDLSAHRLNEAKLQNLALYDALTNLPNRSGLLERLSVAVGSAAHSAQTGALIFLDLDHFRQINETLGPDFGDDLLRESALRLQLCVREADTVAHFGGDEFMVMLDSMGLERQLAATRAEMVANKIRHALSQPYNLRGCHYSGSASLGIVLFDQDTPDIQQLLKMADAAMYQAKSAGRNTVCFYDPAMQAQALARTELEQDMQRALREQEFVLYYQLQMDAFGAPVGAEALLRWQHPLRGMVAPGQFIPLAEETGLILPLGQWVLQAACQQLVLWASQPATAHWSMAVNVSALQFAQADFVDQVAQVLEQVGANPKRLKLELTESMLVSDVDDAIDKMRRVKALGVSLSLDDFGTGYSSLSYLKRFPMDQLKIDQSFVRDLETDPDDAVISQTIVALGHNMGMQVIAEGVESAFQRDFLIKIGCDCFQGYYFARPVESSDLLKNL
jgi:diguanylate cyclase (GGDEF)-like protein/PAS domain S-box-containing protein